METNQIPPHLSAEEYSLLQAEEQLLKDGSQWLKRAANLYTQTPKLKIWLPVVCSVLVTGYYLYVIHARAVPHTPETPIPTVSAVPNPQTSVVADEAPGAPKFSAVSVADTPAGSASGSAPAGDGSNLDLLQQAQQAHSSQQFSSEGKLLQTVLERSSPATPGVCPQIGIAYERAGDLAAAGKSFDRCLSAAPANTDILIAFAHVLLAKQEFGRASALYRQALQQDAANQDARTGLALVELRQNHLPQAAQSAAAVLRKSPNNTDALLITGIVAFRQSRLDDAEQIFNKGIELDDHRADFHAFLGRVAEARGQTQAALQEFEKALALDPGDTELAARRDRLKGNR
jgi:tetratricopeptide (TPR) repeat protein